MKMLLIFYTGSDPRFVSDYLSGHECPWTEFAGVVGHGAHVRHDGSRTFPGETWTTISILEESVCDRMVLRLREVAASMSESERLHMAVLPVEMFE